MRRSLIATSLVAAGLLPAAPALAGIEFLASGALPGTARDTSVAQYGATEFGRILEDGVTPHDLAGGFGSAIAYSGFGNRFLAAPDRGPADGASTYKDRFYEIDIALTHTGSGWAVTPTLMSTTIMQTSAGMLTGSSAGGALRFDPEGIRVSAGGKSVYVSDEYGPYVYEFDRATGNRINSFAVPANLANRVDNRGMEGLAITPDGSHLYGIMQSPLSTEGGKSGYNNRIVEFDASGNALRQFVYQVSNPSYGVSEILAVNDHQFLVIERDGKAGSSAAAKSINLVDITGATDVSGTALPTGSALPAGVAAASKTSFINLLSPAYGLAGSSFPEKIEGLAFGQDLADGRHVLYVTSDNDFNQSKASMIYAFAIDDASLAGFQAQQIAAVPEPKTWGMLLAGLGFIGMVARRRRPL